MTARDELLNAPAISFTRIEDQSNSSGPKSARSMVTASASAPRPDAAAAAVATAWATVSVRDRGLGFPTTMAMGALTRWGQRSRRAPSRAANGSDGANSGPGNTGADSSHGHDGPSTIGQPKSRHRHGGGSGTGQVGQSRQHHSCHHIVLTEGRGVVPGPGEGAGSRPAGVDAEGETSGMGLAGLVQQLEGVRGHLEPAGAVPAVIGWVDQLVFDPGARGVQAAEQIVAGVADARPGQPGFDQGSGL